MGWYKGPFCLCMTSVWEGAHMLGHTVILCKILPSDVYLFTTYFLVWNWVLLLW